MLVIYIQGVDLIPLVPYPSPVTETPQKIS